MTLEVNTKNCHKDIPASFDLGLILMAIGKERLTEANLNEAVALSILWDLVDKVSGTKIKKNIKFFEDRLKAEANISPRKFKSVLAGIGEALLFKVERHKQYTIGRNGVRNMKKPIKAKLGKVVIIK